MYLHSLTNSVVGLTQAGIMAPVTLEVYWTTYSIPAASSNEQSRRVVALHDYSMRKRQQLDILRKGCLICSQVAPLPDMAPADPVPSKAANKPGSFEFDVEFLGLLEPECFLELLVRTFKLNDTRKATGHGRRHWSAQSRKLLLSVKSRLLTLARYYHVLN